MVGCKDHSNINVIVYIILIAQILYDLNLIVVDMISITCTVMSIL
jgi:hypothetical protein